MTYRHIIVKILGQLYITLLKDPMKALDEKVCLIGQWQDPVLIV